MNFMSVLVIRKLTRTRMYQHLTRTHYATLFQLYISVYMYISLTHKFHCGDYEMSPVWMNLGPLRRVKCTSKRNGLKSVAASCGHVNCLRSCEIHLLSRFLQEKTYFELNNWPFKLISPPMSTGRCG